MVSSIEAGQFHSEPIMSSESPRDDTLSVLAVDDDPGTLEFYKDIVAAYLPDVEVDTAGSVGEASEKIAQGDRRHYDLILTDGNLPDGSGFDIAEFAARLCTFSKVFMRTGDPKILNSPFTPEQLKDANLVGILPKADVMGFIAPIRKERDTRMKQPSHLTAR